MATALLHNRFFRVEQSEEGSGLPNYSYTGASVVVDTGEKSGEWIIAFTSTGILTLNEQIDQATIKIQGGGGGSGASDGNANGSDGTDGSIQTLENQSLAVGLYDIAIGAEGERGYDSAGYAGGNTDFADLLTAKGGDGGEYAGGISLEHYSIYSNYGKGGLGGAIDQHYGELETLYYTTLNLSSGYTYIKEEPNKYSGNNGTIKINEVFYLADNTKYLDTDSSVSTTWYKLADGRGYVGTNVCKALTTETNDTRAWYGVAGYSGVVLLSGKV